MSNTRNTSTLPLEFASMEFEYCLLIVTWCATRYFAFNSGAYFPHSFLIPSFSSIGRKPNNSMNFQNLAFANGFVKISVGLSSVGTYTTDTFPSSTASQMKWYRTSICFVREWNLLSFDSAIAPWLLELIVIAQVGWLWISLTKVRSHSASLWHEPEQYIWLRLSKEQWSVAPAYCTLSKMVSKSSDRMSIFLICIVSIAKSFN